MPAKKKMTRKRAKSKIAASSKHTKKTAAKKTAAKRTAANKNKTTRKAATKPARKMRTAGGAGSRRGVRTETGAQSGDLQGLSRVESADSESVDELLEEGNAFEADAVAGVEHADDDPEREVHTHEVPEDDVPEEYLDQD